MRSGGRRWGSIWTACLGWCGRVWRRCSEQPSVDGVRGHIVLVASTAAQRGEAFHADYAASKGALVSMTKSLSSELAGEGIYANCVAPGWVETEMSAAALNDPETSKKVLATIPLGRAARVEEIAGPILFLCTPLAGFRLRRDLQRERRRCAGWVMWSLR